VNGAVIWDGAKRREAMSGEERERILEQIYRYAWLLDEQRFEEWLEIFAEGASYVVTTEENVRCGYAFGPILERKETLRERLAERQHLWWVDPAVTSRSVSNPIVEVLGADQAQARFYMVLYKTREGQVTELFGCAKCFTAWRKIGDRWYIQEFRAVLDSGIILGVLDVPI
jgi:3-phenylpropionate/cinnamic acid dioxygenase small subunit